jgi:chemotaxis protein CheC
LDPADQDILERAVHLGLQHAAEGLSGMIGHPVRLEAARIEVLPIATIREELAPAGDDMVAVYLSLHGEWSAQVMLLFERAMALELIDLLLGQVRGMTVEIDEMGESALKEVGNVMGAFFAGTIADLAETLFVPSTPDLATGAFAALLDARLRDIAARYESVLLIETHISEEHGGVNGYFVVLPDPLEIQRLVAVLKSRE